MTQSKLTGGVVAPCIQLAIAHHRQHVPLARCELACWWHVYDRSGHSIEVHRRPAQRTLGVESPGKDGSGSVDGAEQKLARCNCARTRDARHRLRCRQRNGFESPTDTGRGCSPDHNLLLRGNTKTSAMASANGDQLLSQNDFDRPSGNFQAAAIFERAGLNPTAAITPPT